jgi:hypothetical protein
MAIIGKTFLHFFDIHFLEEKGVRHIPKKIYYEAFFATRFSLLCSEKVFIPAASYFESPTCRKIIDQYLEIVPYGIIWLIGKAHNFLEFCQSKTYQYSNSPDHLSLYESALKSEIYFPFYRRKRSSTKDIKSQWIEKLDFSEVASVFDDCHSFIVPSDIEEKWNNVPKKLENNAFIVPNVVPLLFSNKINNLSVINTLHEIINKSYFQSYVNELDASIVTDLVVLESNYEFTNNNTNIPYGYLLTELKLRNKIDLIKNFHPEELFAFRETDEWIEIFCSSIFNKFRRIRDLQKLYNIGSPEKSIEGNRDITIFTKEVKMGDIYSAGQVGAQGPNAHAENITFNQIWNQNQNKFDFEKLEAELSHLRSVLKNEAETPEQLAELGSVANAEIEAKKGNGPKVLEWLSKTGKWTLGVAEKIGVSIVSLAIKSSLGM